MQVKASCGLPELEGSSSASRGGGAIRRRGKRRPQRVAGAPQAMAAPAAAVQRLFEACREVFNGADPGAVPPPAGIERVKSVLDSITAADVGLTPKMSYFQRVDPCGTPKITYLHLYKCEAFSIGIFCLPSRGIIPLHNHPGMTVFSKLLFGTMHVKSYDWATQQDTPEVPLQGPHLAKVKADGILTAPREHRYCIQKMVVICIALPHRMLVPCLMSLALHMMMAGKGTASTTMSLPLQSLLEAQCYCLERIDMNGWRRVNLQKIFILSDQHTRAQEFWTIELLCM